MNLKEERHIITAPLRFLREECKRIIALQQSDNHIVTNGQSYVSGISAAEIELFEQLYNSTISEASVMIYRNENPLLQNKLSTEWHRFPAINWKLFYKKQGFIPFLGYFLRIVRSDTFYEILNNISEICETMINLIENQEWIELASMNGKQ